MMETTLSGVMDDELIDELTKVAQRFKGKLVKVTIIEVNEQERRPRERNGD